MSKSGKGNNSIGTKKMQINAFIKNKKRSIRAKINVQRVCACILAI